MPINRTEQYVSLASLLSNGSHSDDDELSNRGHKPQRPTENWRLCGGPHDGIETKRTAVLHNLREVHQHLSDLRQQNWSPDMMEAVFDVALMPSMLKAEKAHNSENTAVIMDDGLGTFDIDQTRQAIIKVPGMYHYLAADIREIDGQQSAILFDSLAHVPAYDHPELLQDLSSSLSFADKIAIFCIGTQNSFYECQIFALSNTTKMAKSSDYMDTLHIAHVREGEEGLAALTGAVLANRQGRLSLFKNISSLPANLLKHAQSKYVLNQNNRNQWVNKSGQTLQERQASNTVKRSRIRMTEEKNPELQWINFSASIEDKRMIYLERTIKYMQSAPDEVVDDLATRFDYLCNSKPIQNLFGAQPERRQTGPADQVSLRLVPSHQELSMGSESQFLSDVHEMVGQFHRED
jgi:hypothetical protein